MKVKEKLLEAFGVKPDEATRVGWLIAHSLFIGVFSAFFFSVANALFLNRFEITYIPIAYIVAAIVGYLSVMLFSDLEKRVSIRRLLIINLSFLAIVAAVFWLLIVATNNQWAIFLMFVWVGPAFSLVSLGYWALSVRLFDLRQGKRLFGLVGAGEEVSTVIGLFSVPLLVRFFAGPVHLLLLAVLGLMGCLAVVVVITMRFGDALVIERMERPGSSKRERSGLADLIKNRTFLLMASLVIFLSLGNYMVDFSFLGEVRAKFQGPEQIAQFIGLFFGVTKVLELVLKAFVSGRVLSQFGVKTGLMVLPVLLSICGGFAIAIGTLGLSAASFFVLVALSKMVWVVTRTSMFEPSFRVLYQPVEPVDRLAFQTHVEGTAKQLATGVVGVALLVFSRSAAFNALNLFYALVPLLGMWIVANLLTYKDYRAKLMESLTLRVRKEGVKKPIDALRPHLHAQNPRQRDIGLHVLEKIDPASMAPAMAEMLSKPGVRDTALEYIGKNRVIELKDHVRDCDKNGDPNTRSAAQKVLERLHASEVLAASPERVEKMVRSPSPEARVEAADAIGRGSGKNAPQLSVLLFDQDWSVRQAALKAAGRLGQTEFWPQMITHLSSPVLSPAAAAALVQVGEPVLGEIDKAFNKEELDPNVRLRFLKIYEDIGGEAANGLLANKLTYPDATVRRQALIALSRSGYQADPQNVFNVERAIEQTVGDIVWNMSALADLGDDEAVTKLRAALEEEIKEHRSKLFLLLSLLYDPWSIGLVKENIESESQEATVHALEIMDILVSSDIKPLLFPVLEDLTYAQVLKRLEAWYPRQKLGRDERLSAIINRDYAKIGTWSRACAVQAMSESTAEIRPDLVASLFHPDPLIYEVAARSILEHNAQAYRLRRKKLPFESRERLDFVIGRNGVMEHWESRSVFGRVGLLRSISTFSNLPSEALVRLASASEERILRSGRRLPSTKEPKDSVYIILDGAVSFINEGAEEVKDDLPRFSLIAFGPGTRAIKTNQDSRFIRLDPDQLFELAREYVELIPALIRAEQQIFDFDVHHPQHMSVGSPIEPVQLGSFGQSEV